MRVALFTECYHPIINGVVVSVTTFAEQLSRQGHDVDIYTPAYAGYQDKEPNVHRLPSLPRLTAAMYPITLPYSATLMKDVWSQRPPDIVHAHHPFLTGREARRVARRLGRPLVFTYHTIIRAYAHYVPLPQPWVQRLAVWVSREFSNSADCVIVPTQATADLLRSYGVTARVEVIPTGIDLELMQSSPRRPMRARLGLPEAAPVICYSGRIAREKSLDTLLRAFRQVQGRTPEAHLLLVGGGPWEQECRAQAAALGVADRVRITGFLGRTEVFDCLAEADVFAFPSRTDTQGLVVLEAMAMGCPAVAVQSGAVADIVRNEVDGLLVEPTEEALAAGIDRLLGSPELCRRIAGQARRRAEDFSAGSMAVRLTHVYQSLRVAVA